MNFWHSAQDVEVWHHHLIDHAPTLLYDLVPPNKEVSHRRLRLATLFHVSK
jgi:hypothetical protein